MAIAARRLIPALFLAAPFAAPQASWAADWPPPGADVSAEALGAHVDELVGRGDLVLLRAQPDPDFPGRRHLRYEQSVDGVPVFGADLVRQVDPSGRTLSVFGAIHEGLPHPGPPTLSADQAARAAEAASPRGAMAVGETRLVVLVRGTSSLLTYTTWVRFDQRLDRVFVDARSGEIVHRYSDLWTDSAVGLGTGVWGDRKKVSADTASGGFQAEDRLRPPALTTYDMRFDVSAAVRALDTGVFESSFVARDSDNDWSDGAVVDAHTYAGYTYDYYYKRHGRRGLDDHDLPVRSVTHFLSKSFAYDNAFWDTFSSAMWYGDGDGVYAPFSGALDVVAHELTHGVTQFTWNGIYEGESGALNEAFSDIMGTSVEFFIEPAGNARLHADYYLGEDLTYTFDPPRLATRSMANPGMFCSSLGCDPDNYSIRYRGSADGGGVHVNSGIANQAFYLLVEGGVNRTSGRQVTGLGSANRDKAERIFYRGFTLYLTPSATFSAARAATIRAARDLYTEAEASAVASAWSAVGVE
jgi:bacillolysin